MPSLKKIEYLTINQLIKIGNSSIDYSRENESTLNIIECKFWHFIDHVETFVPLVMFINKFNVVLCFQNLKSIDIVYIFIIYEFFLLIYAKHFFPFQTFPLPCFYDLLPPFGILPHFKETFAPIPLWRVLSPLKKMGDCGNQWASFWYLPFKFCKTLAHSLVFFIVDFNKFPADVPFAYPLKTLVNQKFSGVFKE